MGRVACFIQVGTMSSQKSLHKGGSRDRGDAATEAQLQVMQDHEPKNMDRLQKPEKSRTGITPRTSSGNAALLTP